jgi:transcription initiation factor TFIIIB Brf1 subunit/transcription initiation factor TFIIB
MVDRFLSKASEMSRRVLSSRFQFQLLAMTALYLSIKTYERNVLSIEFFTAISCDQYSVNEIESMELSLLEGLSWNITPPTCVQMAHHILSLVSKLVTIRQTVWAAVLDEVAFQVETAVRDYYFATESPSTVAMAAIFNAIEKIGVQDRQEILNAVLAVMNDEFDSPENVIASKDRLYCLVKEGIEDAQSPRM